MDKKNFSGKKCSGKEKLIVLLPSLAGGGAERVAAMLLPMFSIHFDVTLALLENRRVYDIPREVNLICFSSRLDSTASHLIHIPYHYFALTRLIRRTRTKIVLSFMEEANILNILASRIAGHKAILSQRIVPHIQYAGRGSLGSLILFISKILYPRAEHVITVSSHIRQVLLKDYKLHPNQVTFIPNPVNIPDFLHKDSCASKFPLPESYLLHIGRLKISQKGQDILLDAFSRLKERFPSLSLILVGEGSDRMVIEKLIVELNLSGRVFLTGWQDDVTHFMSKAEMLVLPSRYEGWPNVLVEAMTCGCPVIASDCESGPREIIGDSKYGILVPADNPTALTEAIENSLKSCSSDNYYKECARHRAMDFSIDKIGVKYLDLIYHTFS